MNTQSINPQASIFNSPTDFDFDAIDVEAAAKEASTKRNVIAIKSLLETHLDSHTVSGEVWPADAVYMARYRLKAWPTDAMDHTSFFKTSEELQKWYSAQCKWATYEDNYFMFDSLYMWDLGPVKIDDVTPHIYKS